MLQYQNKVITTQNSDILEFSIVTWEQFASCHVCCHKNHTKCILGLLVGSILTLDATQNFKANNLNTNADFKDREGGSQGKVAAQKERLGFKAEWQWLCHKLWNVEAGTRKSGVTHYSREKDTKQQINLKRIM